MQPGAAGIEQTTLARVAMALGITTALSIISYFAVERPLQSVKQRFATAPGNDAMAVPRAMAS
jgi:peptidoglycan/LPS O-acetylase OafA/YrhL